MKYFITGLSFLFLSSVVSAQVHPDITEDESREALKAISANLPGASSRCLGCHEPTMRLISEWGDTASYRIKTCLEPVETPGVPWTAIKKLECLNGEDYLTYPYRAKRLGLLAAGAHTKVFKDIFIEAYGTLEAELPFKKFVTEAGMPKGHADPMSEKEFEQLYRWLKSDLPYFDRILGTEVQLEKECTESRAPEIDQYLRKRELSNWSRYHLDRGTNFFACYGSQTEDCFTVKLDGKEVYPETATKYFSKRWNADPTVKMRFIAKLPRESSYWTRSSPDGRYFGIGLASEERIVREDGSKVEYYAAILDLRDASMSGSRLGMSFVNAYYDPTFTPDNLGFMFNGVDGRNAGVCPLSVLNTPEGKTVEFNEPGCSIGEVFTYQSMGTSLEDEGTFTLTGTYTSDNAGGSQSGNRDPLATWGLRSFIELTHLPQSATGQYQFSTKLDAWAPFQGDWVIAPSTELAAARTSGADELLEPKQLGYQFFLMSHQNSKVELTPALRVCQKGAKGNFSMDERYFVYHHFVEESDFQELGFSDANDPEFKSMLEAGTANIFVMDLYTGLTKRLTRMEFGQVAAFPHFRADGWLYFLVRDQATKTEWLTAAYWKR